jgi:hypothetical protein
MPLILAEVVSAYRRLLKGICPKISDEREAMRGVVAVIADVM